MWEVESVQRLAEELSDPRDGKSTLLLLGSGFARAVGVPGVEDVARYVFGDLFTGDPATATAFLSREDWEQIQQARESDEGKRKLLGAFYEYVDSLSSRLARSGVFRRFYDGFPVGQTYQDVAQLITLIRDSHLDTDDHLSVAVLSANVDTFLEGALDTLGLYEEEDYCKVDLAVDPKRHRCPAFDGRAVPIVKLHTSVAQSELTGVLDEMAALLRPERRLLMVGYGFQSEPVNQWLAGLAGSSSDLWWLSPERPDPEDLAPLESWNVHYVVGPESDPTVFFRQLGARTDFLLRSKRRSGSPTEEQRLAFLRTQLAQRSWGEPAVSERPGLEEIGGVHAQRKKAGPIREQWPPGRGIRASLDRPGLGQIKGALVGWGIDEPLEKPPAPSRDIRFALEQAPVEPMKRAPDQQRKAWMKQGPSAGGREFPVSLERADIQGGKGSRPEQTKAWLRQGPPAVSREIPGTLERADVNEIKRALGTHEEAELLRRQLAQNREILSVLERQRELGGASDAQLQAQIAYQRAQIAKLEGRLLTRMSRPVVSLMDEIEAAARDKADSNVVSFLENQIGVVRQEYERPEPNEDVLTAAIGGTVLLAERLGDDVVDRRLLRDLAAYLPTGVSRRV